MTFFNKAAGTAVVERPREEGLAKSNGVSEYTEAGIAVMTSAPETFENYEYVLMYLPLPTSFFAVTNFAS